VIRTLPLVLLLACTTAPPEESDTAIESEDSDIETSDTGDSDTGGSDTSIEVEPEIVWDTQFVDNPEAWRESKHFPEPCVARKFRGDYPEGWLQNTVTLDENGHIIQHDSYAGQPGSRYLSTAQAFETDELGRITKSTYSWYLSDGTQSGSREMTATYGEHWGPLTVSQDSGAELAFSYDEVGRLVGMSGEQPEISIGAEGGDTGTTNIVVSGSVSYDDEGRWQEYDFEGAEGSFSSSVVRTNDVIEQVHNASQYFYDDTLREYVWDFVESNEAPVEPGETETVTDRMTYTLLDDRMHTIRYTSSQHTYTETDSGTFLHESTTNNTWQYEYMDGPGRSVDTPFPVGLDLWNAQFSGTTGNNWNLLPATAEHAKTWRIDQGDPWVKYETIYDSAGNPVRYYQYNSSGNVAQYVDYDYSCYEPFVDLPEGPELEYGLFESDDTGVQ